MRANLKYHFKLDEVREINTFNGIYNYLYTFLDAAERFDPLDRDKYVTRSYNTDQFEASESRKVNIHRNKRFYATTAVVLRPQIWMKRSNRVACKHFATQYDHLYSMARYLRFKYQGKSIDGAWQPE